MMLRPQEQLAILLGLLLVPTASIAEPPLGRIEVAADNRSFVAADSGRAFVPWGFNYDHDHDGRLIEDYWQDEWPAVAGDLAEMRALGANVVRVHLQFGKFMDGPREPNRKSLDRLAMLVALAERERLYLDVTGLGCYHKRDVPEWYDALDERGRWDAQADFWQAVAGVCGASDSIFCYDLMNEPVVPGGKRDAGDWLGPPFGDSHFVQCISLDQQDRPRPQIAKEWIDRLAGAIRQVDKRHLITVGLVDWSLDRPGLTSGFVPAETTAALDFLCVHLYPESGKLDDGLATLAKFCVGKPVVIEETFPLSCSGDEMETFINRSGQHAAGWISFYWGKPPAELRRSTSIADALMLGWLERFAKRSRTLGSAAAGAAGGEKPGTQ